jgi:hypothetical protein
MLTRFTAPLTPPLAKAQPQARPQGKEPPSPGTEVPKGKPQQNSAEAKPPSQPQKQKKKRAHPWKCRVCGAKGAKALYPPSGWYRITRQGEGSSVLFFVAICPSADCLIEYLRWVERNRDYDLAHPKDAVFPVAGRVDK